MKKISSIILALFLIVALIYTATTFASPVKNIRVGNLWVKVNASAQQSETTIMPVGAYARYSESYWEFLRCAGTRFGCKNWKDETGKVWPVKLAGAPYGTSDEVINQFSIPDSNAIEIHRYFRYEPPEVIVDGMHLEPPFPRSGDHVDKSKIEGFAGGTCTADVLVESFVRTWMGLSIHARTLAWGQKDHDDYIIWDWTLINTGNIDKDPEIELNQTLDSLYIMRQIEYFPMDPSWAHTEWHDWIGVRPGDSVRMTLFHPWTATWAPNDALGAIWDDFWGSPEYIGNSNGTAEAMIFVPKTKPGGLEPVDELFPNNPASDDPIQPRSHGVHGPDDFAFKHHSGKRPESDWKLVYNVMKFSEKVNPKYEPFVDYMTDAYPNTYHTIPPIDRPGTCPDELPGHWYFWHGVVHPTSGPFNLALGDSIRIVWAAIGASLRKDMEYKLGQAWKAGTLKFKGKDPLPAKIYDEELWKGCRYTDEANLAKMQWIWTTMDSLVKSGLAAQWNFDQGYNIPVPPPPPSLYVNSKPERVEVSWGDESEVASDFAGYKVYRAIGNPGATYQNGQFYGQWEPIFQCGGEEPEEPNVQYSEAVTHSFNDTSAERGQEYYYYVAAFDKGGETDVWGTTEPLESSRWMNRTTQSASLTRSSEETLSKIRVVPNPFNAKAENVQFVGAPNRIVFMNLPPVCTIKIYNFSGDLVKTLEHTDGSGDEAWIDPTHQHYMTTTSGQVVVSGLYIAHITTSDGKSTDVKFLIVR